MSVPQPRTTRCFAARAQAHHTLALTYTYSTAFHLGLERCPVNLWASTCSRWHDGIFCKPWCHPLRFNPGGIVLSDIKKVVPTFPEFFHVRVPRCSPPTSALQSQRIVLSSIQDEVATHREYFYLVAPSCTGLMAKPRMYSMYR